MAKRVAADSRSRELLVERDGDRLDRFLAEAFPEESRSSLQRWVKEGRVTGPRPLKAASKLLVGDRLRVQLPEPPPAPTPLQPADFPLDLLFSDDDLIVINKPAGLTVHPGAGTDEKTLVHALLALGGPLSALGGEERPGIVHRLDKDTSGVIVVARNDSAHRKLSAQFKDRLTDKEYLALVHGAPPEQGLVDSPLGRHPKDRKRQAVRHDTGRAALTRFFVEERFADRAARIRLKIETGRTHQIRVHMASIGHGVLADEIYGRPRFREVPDLVEPVLRRHALHAARLSIDHPHSGTRMTFHAPVPDDIEAATKILRQALGSQPGLERLRPRGDFYE